GAGMRPVYPNRGQKLVQTVNTLIPVVAIGFQGGPATDQRSRAVAREFQRQHPCPSTGETSGPCPGYFKDHVVPLACGGPDVVENMLWQSVGEGECEGRLGKAGVPAPLSAAMILDVTAS